MEASRAPLLNAGRRSGQRDNEGTVTLPGVEFAARPGLFEEKIGAEIFELQEAVHAAHAAYLLTVQAAAEAPMERAQFVLGELRAGLTFLFDDDTQDDDDARLERLAAAYDGAFSQDDVAAALDAYATYAAQHRDSLAGLGGFDPTVIDEAPTVAKRLRDRSAEKLVSTPGALSAEKSRENLAPRMSAGRGGRPRRHVTST